MNKRFVIGLIFDLLRFIFTLVGVAIVICLSFASIVIGLYLAFELLEVIL